MSAEDQRPLLPTHRGNVDQDAIAQKAKLNLQSAARIVGALSAGKLPTQEQISALGRELLKSELLQPNQTAAALNRAGRAGGRLSGQGERVVKDLRDVFQIAMKLGLEKNDDDKIQQFLYTCSQADVDADANIDGLPTPSRKEVNADADEALASLKTLGQLVVSSSAFRSILSDTTLIFRDLAADAAEAAAGIAQQASDVAGQAADQAKDAAGKARPSEQERKDGVKLPSGEEAKGKARQQRDQVKAKANGIDTVALRRDANAKMADLRSRAKTYVDEKTPDDARDAAIERLKKLVVQVQSEPQYKEAVGTLLDLVKKYGRVGADVASKAQDGVDVDANDQAQDALSQLRKIIETLAGGRSLDPTFSALDAVVKDVQNDDRLGALFKNIDEYVDRLLFDEGYVLENKASRRADSIMKQAREIADDNAAWKEDVTKLSDELSSLWHGFADDKTLQLLGEKLERLGQDLSDFGSAGLSSLQKEGQGMLRDVIDVFIPRLLNSIQSIPLPRVEYKSADFDFAIDNVDVISTSFIPDLFRLQNNIDFSAFQGYACAASTFDTSLTLTARGIRLSAANIAYYLYKKTGFPSYEDSGKIDFTVGHGDRDGLHLKVKLANAGDKDRETFFTVQSVEVELENFDIKIHDSKHWFLNWFAHPTLRAVLAQQLAKALEAQIAESFRKADFAAYGAQQRAVAAGKAAATPAEFLRAMFAPTPSMGGGPSVDLVRDGLLIKGSKGESLIAIGMPNSILPAGKGVQREAVQQAKGTIRQAQRAVDQAKDAASSAQDAGERQRRAEARKTGWQSAAFDL